MTADPIANRTGVRTGTLLGIYVLVTLAAVIRSAQLAWDPSDYGSMIASAYLLLLSGLNALACAAICFLRAFRGPRTRMFNIWLGAGTFTLIFTISTWVPLYWAGKL